jgi:hypothetical protein
MAVGSVDQSAADWAAQTLAAAEAYAEEQAAQAAQERAQAEAAAAAGSRDAVDPPPSAHQRALDAFYANDPNRPSNTLPGAAQSDPGGPTPVSLTPQEAADMQAAGLSVTPAGNGTYLINAPTENINIVEKPPVEPPPSLPIPPSHGGNTTTARPSDPPAAPPNPPPAAEAVRPPEKTNERKPAPKIDSGMGKAADDILNKSPTLRKQWADAKEKGWRMVEAEPGTGSRADPNKDPPTIFIDKSQVAKGPGYDAGLASLMAHEIGHAATPFSPPLPGNTKDEFVDKNVRKDLEHEGAAAFENARARDEILNAKPPGHDIGIRGGSDSDYIDTYNAYKSGAITEEQAKSQMATTYSQEPQDRDASTGRYRTKEEQLADKYGKDWDKAHPQ